MRNKKAISCIVAGLAVFLIIGGITEMMISLLRSSQLEGQRAAVLDKVATVRARLEGEINSTLHLTRGMIAYVATHPQVDSEEFSQLASEIIFVGRNIRNIGLAKDNVITHMYPLAGNEAAIGIEYEKIPAQWPAVRRVMDLKGTVVAGPVDLVQGGQAFIARTPIYTRTGISGDLARHKPSYWGLASIVINMPELFQAAGFMTVIDGLAFALRGKDGLGAEGAVIVGDAGLFAADPVLATIPLPNGSWQIAAIPIGGWGYALDPLWLPRLAGWGMALITAVLIGALLWARELNRRLALHDHLTKLPNRRLLEDRLEQEIVRAQREKQVFGLLFVDLDGFKQVNDRYGHKVGDGLLVEVANRLLATVRSVDTVARLGGDEFVILAGGINNTADLQQVREQITRSLNGAAFVHGVKLDVRASVGGVSYPADGETSDALLMKADKRMYAAKHSGKVHVVDFG